MKGVDLCLVPVLGTLAADMMYWKKIAVFPSQQRILKELNKKFGITRCRRTYNRWAAAMESLGFIKRKKRHKKDGRLGWTFRSSLYTITGLGWRALIKAEHFTWDQFRMLKDAANATFRKPKNPREVFRSSGELTSVGEIVDGLGFDSS